MYGDCVCVLDKDYCKSDIMIIYIYIALLIDYIVVPMKEIYQSLIYIYDSQQG